jgi:hypothetical protein
VHLLIFFHLDFFSFLSLSACSCSWVIPCSTNSTLVQAVHVQKDTNETKQALYKLFAAYVHTVPLEKLIESVERARRDAQLRYVVIYGTACSYCLSRAEPLDGSYLRTFALELKKACSDPRCICHVDSSRAARAPRRGTGC